MTIDRTSLEELARKVVFQDHNEDIKEDFKIALAESCTGGLVSALLTDVPGSSSVFDRSFVTYSNEAKQEMLGVAATDIEQYGAVSEVVALAMAEGAKQHSDATIAVSITGIAGPGGGTDEKPVGTVVFGRQRHNEAASTWRIEFGSTLSRQEIRYQAAEFVLKLLLP